MIVIIVNLPCIVTLYGGVIAEIWYRSSCGSKHFKTLDSLDTWSSLKKTVNF